MHVKNANIRGQDSVYRRGLVLGLTMAEIMVLILFALLLALGAVLSDREKAIQAREKRIAELVALESHLSDLLRGDASGVTVRDIIQRIERQKAEIAALRQEVDRLKPYETTGKAIENIIAEIKRREGKGATEQEIVDRIEQAGQLARENENLKGQVSQLTNQIRAIGRGNEFPSCWVTPEGKVESIFELVIGANGIVVKNRILLHRDADKALLPLSSIKYDAELSLGDFTNQLRPLYQWSVNKGCRFYVIIASSVSNAPIQLVNAINSFFYPDSRIQYRPGSP